MAQAQIGISAVAPELIKDMLPAGVPDLPFTFTIQAPGVSVFSDFATAHGPQPVWAGARRQDCFDEL